MLFSHVLAIFGDGVGKVVTVWLGSIVGVSVCVEVGDGEGEIVGDGDSGGFTEVPVVNCHVLFVVGL